MGYWCQQPDGELENMRHRKKETDFELFLMFCASQHVNPCLTYCGKNFLHICQERGGFISAQAMCASHMVSVLLINIYLYIF